MNRNTVLVALGIGSVLGIGWAVYRDRNAADDIPVDEPAAVTADAPLRIGTGGGYGGSGYNPNITPPQQITTPNIPNTTPIVTPPGNQTTALAGRGDGVNGGVYDPPMDDPTTYNDPPAGGTASGSGASGVDGGVY